MNMRKLIQWQVLSGALLCGQTVEAETALRPQCGVLHSAAQYGPYDYRTAKRQSVEVVLVAHYNDDVDSLRSGMKGIKSPGPDLDYTLRALPNFARALAAMTKLAEREKTEQPYGARYTVSCYFERALAFQPDDKIARMLYVNYLVRRNRTQEATEQLDYLASTAEADDPLTHFNLGLLYAEARQAEKALAQARKAEELGKPGAPIVQRLKDLGLPTTPAASDPPASAASAAAMPANATH